MSSTTGPDVLQQVDRFWSMLDDLCQHDPEAYRTLIEKQMKDGAELRSAPELHFCLRTQILVSLFVIHDDKETFANCLVLAGFMHQLLNKRGLILL